MIFIDEIKADIDWRISELASLKTIPLRYKLIEDHKQILIKYAVLSLYAIWEGFVKKSFEVYAKKINSLELSVEETNINILTHALSIIDKLKLENSKNDFISKKNFVELYQETIKKPLFINFKIPTKSNINYEVMNNILLRFNLEPLPLKYKDEMNKLLMYRNSIAHGDFSLPVNMDIISNFSQLINDLMCEIIIYIKNGYDDATYKVCL